MEQDDPPSPFKVPATPGAPLYPTSPERMNQNRPPQSPAVAAVLTSLEKQHRRKTSEVQSKVAFLNGLSRPGTPSTPVLQPQTNASSTSAALQRALLGREEAESALSSANAELSEANARERKISERVESLIEDLQSTKERQAHERQIFEKEVRKARKDAFRAGSALVKLQEDLKEARTENSSLRKDIQREKEAKELAKQEAFERAYTLSGQAEEIELMKGQLRSLEAERDAAHLEIRAEKLTEPKSDANLPKPIPNKPTREGLSEEQYIGNTMAWIKEVVRGDEPEEIDELRWTIKGLQFQLKGALHEVEEQKKNAKFSLLECQGKLCPCRLAEMRGEIYIYDQEKHDRRMERDEAFAQKYREELERLKPVRKAFLEQEAKSEAQHRADREAKAPARAEWQRKWEERTRRMREKAQALNPSSPAGSLEALSSGRSASTREQGSTADANPRASETEVAFSPTTGTFRKVPTSSARVYEPYFPKFDSSKPQVPDEPVSFKTLPEEDENEVRSTGRACGQEYEDLARDPKDGQLQGNLQAKSRLLKESVHSRSEGVTPQKGAVEEETYDNPLYGPAAVPATTDQDVHEGPEAANDAVVENQEIITQPLPRPLSALTMAGDSPLRRRPNSPALSASSSVPALAPPEEVLISDDEGDIVPSTRASDAHLAIQSHSSPTLDEELNTSIPRTPRRPRSQIIGAIPNIATTTTTVPLRGHDDTMETVSPVPKTPGTPVSREAALAQIRARRDRARSVVLKETKSAPGTPARRGLAGGLSVMRSAGPSKGVEKAREFSAHSNAF